jgi:hypothetical protein
VCNHPAWFDVQREGKIGYSEAQVVELDFNSNVKRVKFTFYRLKSDRDEWVEVGSPRIAPHHAYTPRPFIGGTSTKIEDNAAGVKEKIEDVESQEAVGATALVAFSEPVTDYLNTWLSLHAANPIPNSDEKCKIMSDTGLSASQLDDWLRARKKANKKKDDGLTDQQKKEKELKKKMNEELNNYLGAWLLRPENVKSNPVAAATPTAESKEWLAKQLGVDRARIDSWFYRRRKKLKKQHMPDDVGQASTPSTTAVSAMPQPQPTQAMSASTANTAKKTPPASQYQLTVNPNLNLPSNHQRPQNQTAFTANAQVSVSLNQQLPSPVKNEVAIGQSIEQSSYTGVPPPKQTGLSDEAKQYLTQWLVNTSNPYPSKELKDKIMAHFGIENTRTLDGFLTRTRKKLNLQNKQSVEKTSAPETNPNHFQPALASTATQPGASAQMNRIQAAAQMNSTQNATAGSFQPVSSAPPVQSSNLDSLLTAVELVNSQKQYSPPQRSHQHGPNQFGQRNFAPPASAIGVGSPQYRQSDVGQQHQEQPNYQHHREQPHQQHQQHQQQDHRFSHSPPMDTSNASRYEFLHNGLTYHNEQQCHFSHTSHVQQYQPAQTREQSILTAYQNLQEMEIHDRLSSRSSPAEAEATARQHPMQNNEANPQYNSQACRENQQHAYGAIQQQNTHGQHPNK